ncbi:MAG: hypothetical protein KDA61_04090 [Planctomycetales bacterium]|nr:hypothetical protein [Planctomycetales bacterium]MCA9188731.1 hypothetical protein [Planctomycetales bacterium]MCA9258354.1 hypothetical protein [Planctomycetales bacterium]
MTKHPPIQLVICPECGAATAANIPTCWLCHRSIFQDEEVVDAQFAQNARAIRNPKLASITDAISAIMLFGVIILMVLFTIGLVADSKSEVLAIPLLIAFLPGIIAAGIGPRFMRDPSGNITWGGRLLSLLLFSGIATGVLVMLAIALLVAFFVYCITVIAQGG